MGALYQVARVVELMLDQSDWEMSLGRSALKNNTFPPYQVLGFRDKQLPCIGSPSLHEA